MNPYPGLRPFEADEREIFFGRDEECAVLVDKLLAHRLTLLFAASGVGKTSLLRAAVVPRLCDPEAEHLDAVVHRDWVEEPIAGLKQAIVDALRASGRLQEGAFRDEVASASLVELCELCTLFVRPPLVLILDQFEEFFRYQRHAATYEPFLEQLGALVGDRSLPVAVVLSMREDFALELDALRPFVRGVPFENYFRLERLSVARAEEAIVAPVEAVGYRYESELAEALSADLADRGDEQSLTAQLSGARMTVNPPYLQIACLELWQLERRQPRRVLRFVTYEEQGRAAGLLEVYVNRVLGGLGVAEKPLASRAFDHLITRRGTKMAYTVADLAEAVGTGEKALGRTLKHLAEAKILRGQSRRGVLWYELHHDLFSGIVERWNRQFKALQRRRQAVVWAMLVVLVAGVLRVAYDGMVNLTTHHLRLDERRGVSDAVEIYRGKPRSWDVFGAREYVAETGVERSAIEPHRVFEAKTLEGLESVEEEVAGYLPLAAQVEALWRAGRVRQALELAERSMAEDDTGQIAYRLAELGSLEAAEMLCLRLAETEKLELKIRLFKALGRTGLNQAAECLENELEGAGTWLRQEVAEALGALGAKWAVPLWVDMLADPSEPVRFRAASALGSLGSAEAVPPLIEKLSDRSGLVRSHVASALGSLGSKQAVLQLIERLSDSDVRVRYRAALALGSLGSVQAVEPLIQNLIDPEEEVRDGSASALASLGSAEAVPPLIEQLSEPLGYLLGSPEDALRSLGSPEAVAPLIERLSHPKGYVRIGAASVLGSLGSMQAVSPLIEKLSDSNAGVRSSAASALGSLGTAAAVSPLIELLSDPDELVRSSAASALGFLGSMQAVEPLIKKLVDPPLRFSAVSALGRLGNAEAVSPLIEKLSDPEVSIRSLAALALGSLNSEEAVLPLIEKLSDPEESVRSNAAFALGFLGSAEAVPPLIEKLSDPEESVRSSAASALGFLGSAEAVSPLIEKLSDPEGSVRSSVASSLGSLGSAKAVSLLVEKLSDPEESVRLSVASALGALGEATAPLIGKLSDPEGSVRSSAAAALGSLGSAEAVSPLIEKLSDPEESVRSSAASALGSLGGEEAVLPLIEKLADPRSEVRRATLLALGALADQRAHPPSLGVYQEEEHRLELRLAAAAALFALKDDRGLVELQNAAASPLTRDRRRVAEFLGDARAEAGVPLLEALLGDRHLDVRSAAVKALGRLASPSSVPLLRLLAIDGQPTEARLARLAVDALAEIGTEEAITALRAAVQARERTLGFRLYRHLAELGATQAFPDLQERLSRLEREHQDWRRLRDRDTAGMASGKEKAWSKRVAAERPETAWGWEVARAIARLRPDTGYGLLHHDLAAVREGAGYGLAEHGGVALVERLDQARDEDRSYPFRVAAFQTIDHTLRHLEWTGGARERQALLDLLAKLKDRAAVCTRVEWTIQVLDRESILEQSQCNVRD